MTDTLVTVVAAAIKYKDVVLSVPQPGRHGTILNWLYSAGLEHSGETADRVHGFLLNNGTFVNRYEAFSIAKAAGQYRKDGQYGSGPDSEKRGIVFSEDLW